MRNFQVTYQIDGKQWPTQTTAKSFVEAFKFAEQDADRLHSGKPRKLKNIIMVA